MSQSTVRILGRKKGSSNDWLPMCWPVKDRADAEAQLRNRSGVLDYALDFAIETVTIEPFAERGEELRPQYG